jgi:DNA-binding MarR family transcriptional regulator
MKRQERLVCAMAPSGCLFLLITLKELRRQGLTYLALYALMRTVEVSWPTADEGFPISALRSETGLDDFEISRACALLRKSDLVEIHQAAGDAREKILMPTARGHHALSTIRSTAADRLWNGIDRAGRIRRFKEATDALRQANHRLLGPLQLSFFDKDLFEKKPRRSRGQRPKSG